LCLCWGARSVACMSEIRRRISDRLIPCAMGSTASQLEKDIGSDQFPQNEHYFGLVNFGNTCYSNSVLQALFFCKPFREKVLEYKAKNKRPKESLLSLLAELFHSIVTQKRRVGSIAPKKFIARLRKEKTSFDNYNQHDAHEFLNFLINHVNEILLAEQAKKNGDTSEVGGAAVKKSDVEADDSGGSASHRSSGPDAAEGSSSTSSSAQSSQTWICDIFQGIFTSETRCLNCETITSKDEDFFELSINIDQNTSISSCLRSFSKMETLSGADNKFKCDTCRSYQEAHKRMRIKRLPTILAIHLKRFNNRMIKVSHRVVFPLELRLYNTSDDCQNPDRLYDLVAAVIHCGTGLNRGHYISIVKSYGFWLLFDDDVVDKIDPSTIEDFYGLTTDIQKSSETGYILFYQTRDAV